MTPQEALDELGSDEGAVLTSLQTWGVQGTRGAPDRCPIAKYLAIRGHRALVFPDKIWGTEEDFMLDTPPAITDFLIAFDKGSYPTMVNRRREP
jgi:hypothetical protein